MIQVFDQKVKKMLRKKQNYDTHAQIWYVLL